MEMCQLNKAYRLIKAQISLNLYIRTHFWINPETSNYR